jgi:hypothetical protein
MMIKFESFLAASGKFVKVSFQTEKKPAAAHKGNTLQKVTTGIFRAGINFSNLGSVKDAIANGERGAVQPLPWGEWVTFPYVIKHKESFYLRLYPAKGAKVETTYMVNGEITTKADFDSYLTPSDAKSPDKFECFTVKCENVIALCDDITHEEILEAI